MTAHECYRAKAQPLVKELDKVLEAQIHFLKEQGVDLSNASDDPRFIYLLEREEIINQQLERIDRTDRAYN